MSAGLVGEKSFLKPKLNNKFENKVEYSFGQRKIKVTKQRSTKKIKIADFTSYVTWATGLRNHQKVVSLNRDLLDFCIGYEKVSAITASSEPKTLQFST